MPSCRCTSQEISNLRPQARSLYHNARCCCFRLWCGRLACRECRNSVVVSRAAALGQLVRTLKHPRLSFPTGFSHSNKAACNMARVYPTL
jgi:hypothetical protein